MFDQVTLVLKNQSFILQHPDCLLFFGCKSFREKNDNQWTTRRDEAQTFERPKDAVMQAKNLNLLSCFVCRSLEEVAQVTIADKEPW